ncbi:hypothetical protein EBME_1317 [bacterium endosymbiont of Mortierella elongata FMR23-6]|nr:hypothetical protein EBME_1317 [bacterium endosymbiont of Mortierella elongata FMR23-6]
MYFSNDLNLVNTMIPSLYSQIYSQSGVGPVAGVHQAVAKLAI